MKKLSWNERSKHLNMALAGATLAELKEIFDNARKELILARSFDAYKKVRTFGIGANVKFKSKKMGGYVTIKITKKGSKNLYGVTSTGARWRVAATLCEKA